MRLISPLLKRGLYPALARCGYLRRRRGSGPAVLTYHGIMPAGYRVIDADLDGSLVTPDSFRQQLQLLKRRYNVISPEQFLMWRKSEVELPPQSVLLTCDDGLRNALTDMLPLLHEASLSCLFFVTGASLEHACSMLWYEELYLMMLAAPHSSELDLEEIGLEKTPANHYGKRSLWWHLVKLLSGYESGERRGFLERIRINLGLSGEWHDQYRQESGDRFLLLDLPGLRRLAAEGMSVGAHTLSHPMLAQLSAESAWNEIFESRRAIERVLEKRVWALAYPFGDPVSTTSREVRMAERAGFTCAFLNVGGGFGATMSRFAMPRVHVTSGMRLAEFEAHVSGFHRWLRETILSRPQDAFRESGD
jgi:peptidoglycan/xylan/chitin deacetylase (PgdA/CDA1 family)